MHEDRLRPAGRATREAIAVAAREMFHAHGYDGASVRAIAAAAHIDPALVIRHFGSKQQLFLRVIEPDADILDVISGPLDGLGRRVVRYMISDEAAGFRADYVLMTAAAHHPQVREALLERSARLYVDPVAARLEGEHRDLRTTMAAAQLNGLLTTFFVHRDTVLSPEERDYVVAAYGDAVQRLLTP
jgi:AcrR family transcriptional regulator